MTEQLLSVGIDLGTTTTQMVVSHLSMVNTAAVFSVPKMEIQDREVLYRSKVHFTPLLSADTLDACAIKKIIREEYRLAGICAEDVQTGAVIITGETARKENAREVLRALSDLAGDFVVATAGPALESVLAAKGAGADRLAKEYGSPVLNFDIGGGTTNLAYFDSEGNLLETGCLNVGGRLMKFESNGVVTYVSPVLSGMEVPEKGEQVTEERLAPLVEQLVQVLEAAAGLRAYSPWLEKLITDRTVSIPQTGTVFSFSGGVADLIETSETNWLKYGDLGVLLGRAIRQSALCKSDYVLGRETLRATVIGAGSYSTELSGSTIRYTGIVFPMHNLPVLVLQEEEDLPKTIRSKAEFYEEEPYALFLSSASPVSFAQVSYFADQIAASVKDTQHPVVVILKQDFAKALGQALQCRLPNRPILCLDGLQIPEGSYLDVGAPVANGTAVPVVVKTLAFSE